jgi:hypothetical protein
MRNRFRLVHGPQEHPYTVFDSETGFRFVCYDGQTVIDNLNAAFNELDDKIRELKSIIKANGTDEESE